jgi:hypothetical protein
MSGDGIRPMLPHLRLEELYPDWSTEVDRRISASEVRIKFWVVGGALMNFMVAVGASIPLIFYMGQISTNISQSSVDIKTQTQRLDTNSDWVRDRMVWEAKVEAALEKQNIHVAREER